MVKPTNVSPPSTINNHKTSSPPQLFIKPKHYMVSKPSHATVVDDKKRDTLWKSHLEHKVNNLENTLHNVLQILEKNKIQQDEQLNLLNQFLTGNANKTIIDCPAPTVNADFRFNGVIDKSCAQELLNIFEKKFAFQLFGYEMKNLSVELLWNECPILLNAISAVACTHNPLYESKFDKLLESLQYFASQLLNSNNANNIAEINSNLEYTVLALIISVFWLDNCQMFIAIAIQLIRNHKVDQNIVANTNKENNAQLWRLWYLLYILDGTQDLTSGKSPSIMAKDEPLLLTARNDFIRKLKTIISPNQRNKNINNNLSNSKTNLEILFETNISGEENIATEKQLLLMNNTDVHKIHIADSLLQDIRLLTQLEYHMSIESIFKSHRGNASRKSILLMDPTNFGIMWKTNMSLDRWMLSWTIALQYIDVETNPWALKSTLLYYNFARLYINAKPLLDYNGNLQQLFSTDQLNKIWDFSERQSTNEDKNREVSASRKIANSSAISLLKLTVKDKDIQSTFQFLPIHIYVMLYFASLVVLLPFDDDNSNTNTSNGNKNIEKIICNMKLVEALYRLFCTKLHCDKLLKKKLCTSVKELIDDVKKKLKEKYEERLIELNEDDLEETHDNDGSSKTNNKIISAWPGINHGHPSI
ncbi:uncharacterized protein SCODWIG_00564 [Saccharomycodes ludwigii]|uniref:Transcription factor domain-containing protein n=1 Tax=Saccharomycodes ludwigii TaxID=36035 RepID=A0A376B2B1_9ASCO|nr:uncharacterized protein SCODWIG_00564 [Saccharomycodes ludwigii]